MRAWATLEKNVAAMKRYANRSYRVHPPPTGGRTRYVTGPGHCTLTTAAPLLRWWWYVGGAADAGACQTLTVLHLARLPSDQLDTLCESLPRLAALETLWLDGSRGLLPSARESGSLGSALCGLDNFKILELVDCALEDRSLRPLVPLVESTGCYVGTESNDDVSDWLRELLVAKGLVTTEMFGGRGFYFGAVRAAMLLEEDTRLLTCSTAALHTLYPEGTAEAAA
eukprot:gene22301-46583_t